MTHYVPVFWDVTLCFLFKSVVLLHRSATSFRGEQYKNYLTITMNAR